MGGPFVHVSLNIFLSYVHSNFESVMYTITLAHLSLSRIFVRLS